MELQILHHLFVQDKDNVKDPISVFAILGTPDLHVHKAQHKQMSHVMELWGIHLLFVVVVVCA
jgi:hypothetical protein